MDRTDILVVFLLAILIVAAPFIVTSDVVDFGSILESIPTEGN